MRPARTRVIFAARRRPGGARPPVKARSMSGEEDVFLCKALLASALELCLIKRGLATTQVIVAGLRAELGTGVEQGPVELLDPPPAPASEAFRPAGCSVARGAGRISSTRNERGCDAFTRPRAPGGAREKLR